MFGFMEKHKEEKNFKVYLKYLMNRCNEMNIYVEGYQHQLSLRSALRADLIEYIIMLSYSNGKLDKEEKDFIKRIFDYELDDKLLLTSRTAFLQSKEIEEKYTEFFNTTDLSYERALEAETRYIATIKGQYDIDPMLTEVIILFKIALGEYFFTHIGGKGASEDIEVWRKHGKVYVEELIYQREDYCMWHDFGKNFFHPLVTHNENFNKFRFKY